MIHLIIIVAANAEYLYNEQESLTFREEGFKDRLPDVFRQIILKSKRIQREEV